VRYRVTGEAFQRFSVAVEEPLGAAGEVLVLADPFDLGFEASMMRALTLVPLTRATASALLARSSGSRTLVCLAVAS